MKAKILLDKHSDACRLVEIASKLPEDEHIRIIDGNGLVANARSILGALSAMEYSEIWLICEKDYYVQFKDFIALEG
jgi:hypothetical protein